MQNPYLTMRPSLLRGIIRQCMVAESTSDLFVIYKKAFADQAPSKARTEIDTIFDDIPDNLRPLAEALYGLVEATDEPEGNESKDDSDSFPLTHV